MVLPGLVLVGKDSLAFVDSRFTRRPDGSVVWHGTRPGPDWHKHDFPTRRSSMLDGGEVKEVLLLRRRWKLKGTNTTQLDRVPDEIPLVRACTLVVLLTHPLGYPLSERRVSPVFRTK